ncbi:UDP-2,3-diacylglucosamine pyrophosphatase LpxH [Rhodovulum bhavnagarense]|uniref:UDP-2,3-diacylglucosamine pyrophosphatase LpxH n=1 Tax=Rhodovulum bhavnagarense TaxID=992286 RepID=A0A4R2RMA7_9RHOB|nr:UDP-2,3-diacylglucosamine diphosphatase [Rhodovulum bhavnagarense]TCP60881.1 UDP-2,3-diacylglucosamine pyrophosphatase LpxH [Rhodovulum bhavnagarense]
MSNPKPRKVRSVFVSDLHLGYKGADITALNAFLRAHEFERIYLVGDVLDGWKLESRWYWNQDYSDLVDMLLERRRRRVRITLITGNHDEKLRDILAILFRPVLLRRFGIRVEERIVHRARDGREYLVMHGDQFDGALTRSSSRFADRIWSFLVERALVRPRPSDENAPGRGRRWSLGKEIAKNALHLANRYARRALRRASEDGMDGIVCGHSHLPLMRRQGGILLANCGSWTGAKQEGGHHTAVIETLEGQFEMVEWPAMRPAPGHPRIQALPPHAPGTRHPDAARLVRLIHALWSPPRMAEGDAAPVALPPHEGARLIAGETRLQQAG